MQSELSKRKTQAFEMSLRLIFTEWQMKIIRKRLRKEPLTESERVEFSRHIRKVIVAMDVLKDLRLLLY